MLFARQFFGGGSGAADWSVDERAAIRAILGIPASGSTPETPSAGVLAEILERALLIGTGNGGTGGGPVMDSGEFAGPLVIGDDYLVANGREIAWTITSSVAPAIAKLGFRNRKDSSQKFTLTADDALIDALGDSRYRIKFNFPGTTSNDKRPGDYEYSMDIRDSEGRKATFRHSHFFAEDGTPARNYATLVERFTEDE